MIDVLLQGGSVVDGSGTGRFRADVAIERDRIVEVGVLPDAVAREVIDASGQVVTPGIIDMHSHADYSLPICPTADSLVHQGITTVVGGQCGISTAPLLGGTRDEVIHSSDFFGVPLPWERWSSLAEYLEYLGDKGISVNLVPLVGQGTIRAAVMGYVSGDASEEQMAQMRRLAEASMDEGAIGISTGLIYPPGSYTSTEELVTLTRLVGQREGFYFSHIRGEGETLLDAINEAIHIGRETGAAIQISHLKAGGRKNWHLAPKALALIQGAREEGLDVTADMYTYPAGSTGMRTLLPEWALDGGVEAALGHLRDPATRERMTAEMQTTGFCSQAEFDKVLVASSPHKPEIEGRLISELAEEASLSPYEWIFDTLLETNLDVMTVHFMMSEENIRLQLAHPATMVSTDSFGLSATGPLSAGKPHPRCYGTYPRLFGRYVREQRTLSLEDAVWKSTGFPAQKLRWTDRGLVRKGYKADLVVFDPDTILDTATYEDPHQYPRGISHVLINGVAVIRDGQHTQERAGLILGAG
jgi:N-acyl-D-amino-acid deacylase